MTLNQLLDPPEHSQQQLENISEQAQALWSQIDDLKQKGIIQTREQISRRLLHNLGLVVSSRLALHCLALMHCCLLSNCLSRSRNHTLTLKLSRFQRQCQTLNLSKCLTSTCNHTLSVPQVTNCLHSHALTFTCTCCYDVINGMQRLQDLFAC